jgi:hypothetical protein
VVGSTGAQPTRQRVDEKLISPTDTPVLLRHHADQFPDLCLDNMPVVATDPQIDEYFPGRLADQLAGDRHRRGRVYPKGQVPPHDRGLHLCGAATSSRDPWGAGQTQRGQHAGTPLQRGPPADAPAPQERLQPLLLLRNRHPQRKALGNTDVRHLPRRAHDHA